MSDAIIIGVYNIIKHKSMHAWKGNLRIPANKAHKVAALQETLLSRLSRELHPLSGAHFIENYNIYIIKRRDWSRTSQAQRNGRPKRIWRPVPSFRSSTRLKNQEIVKKRSNYTIKYYKRRTWEQNPPVKTANVRERKLDRIARWSGTLGGRLKPPNFEKNTNRKEIKGKQKDSSPKTIKHRLLVCFTNQ